VKRHEKLFQVSYWGQKCIYATCPSIAVQRKRQLKREREMGQGERGRDKCVHESMNT